MAQAKPFFLKVEFGDLGLSALTGGMPADALYQLTIFNPISHLSVKHGVKQVVFAGGRALPMGGSSA